MAARRHSTVLRLQGSTLVVQGPPSSSVSDALLAQLTPVPADAVKRSKLLEEVHACMLQSAGAPGDGDVVPRAAASDPSAEVPLAPKALHLWLHHVRGTLSLDHYVLGTDIDAERHNPEAAQPSTQALAGEAALPQIAGTRGADENAGETDLRMPTHDGTGIYIGPGHTPSPPHVQCDGNSRAAAAASRSAGHRLGGSVSTASLADVFTLLTVRRFNARLKLTYAW